MKFADLHLHTSFSDGTFSPRELVKLAREKGLDCIAITDHDAVEGIAPSFKIANTLDLEIIPAIELTSQIQNSELHVLGYFIDWKSKGLLKKLEELKTSRISRVYEMVKKLNDLGLDIKTEEVLKLAGKGTVGRPHVARVLYQKGITKSISEAFLKYIGDDGPAYVARFRLSPKEAIRLVLESKGIPVLAHPYSPGKDELIGSLVDDGLMGLEVFSPNQPNTLIKHYEGIALKYGLLITGGSDCHGEAKDEVLIGKIKLPYPYVEELKKRKAHL